MIIRKGRLSVDRSADERSGTSDTARYSDAGGLTQYGAYVQTEVP